jgi:hypothetical protein
MRRTVLLLIGIAALGGCGGEQIPTETAASLKPQAIASRGLSEASGKDQASINKDLATLRSVTATFHSFEKAEAAGWGAQITPCMVDPGGAGGMGFHYGNTHLIDGTARVDEPELLLYEPESNGRLRLVAVEYIIPYTFVPRSAPPPELFGQKFAQNDTFQLWGLHAWVWENNPSGIFKSWNPRVNCNHATAVMAMAH